MSKKDTRKILKHAVTPGMDKTEALKAELDMAIGCIISQKMTIARLRTKLKKHGISEEWEEGDLP